MRTGHIRRKRPNQSKIIISAEEVQHYGRHAELRIPSWGSNRLTPVAPLPSLAACSIQSYSLVQPLPLVFSTLQWTYHNSDINRTPWCPLWSSGFSFTSSPLSPRIFVQRIWSWHTLLGLTSLWNFTTIIHKLLHLASVIQINQCHVKWGCQIQPSPLWAQLHWPLCGWPSGNISLFMEQENPSGLLSL